ncbi:hypothetical protein GY21_09210 [Cryobacterium roopkundense]|uniref:Thioredoxin-like negative regulator of GroEL n=1 Tax=Cryobacterium roopkundense TaxID=1001240 RepID=A0A099JDZ9_9MICO|nr:thioredoxin family protein [Cryobacterium roopkundense]KGJ76471.1 hypothetical protein GY21_09210 [Cryobacterium roopkundense]MBB5640338.1 thioredoxin-like negative regulator of GroEL [Cryobacterium roopkundense]
MDPLVALALLLGLVAVATALGLTWRSRQGRVSLVAGDVITATDVGSQVPFGTQATLVQFSTPWCARCPGTKRLLATAAGERPGVVHLEVDVSHRADLASRFAVMQTPTTLILDAGGRVRARVGGVPVPADIHRHLDELVGSHV